MDQINGQVPRPQDTILARMRPIFVKLMEVVLVDMKVKASGR
jgi:hypothetical protein